MQSEFINCDNITIMSDSLQINRIKVKPYNINNIQQYHIIFK